jgi:hypothetical protein
LVPQWLPQPGGSRQTIWWQEPKQNQNSTDYLFHRRAKPC